MLEKETDIKFKDRKVRERERDLCERIEKADGANS